MSIDITAAIEVAATALLRENAASSEYHSDSWTWREFAPQAKAAIEAALPVLREQLASLLDAKVCETCRNNGKASGVCGLAQDHAAIVRGDTTGGGGS